MPRPTINQVLPLVNDIYATTPETDAGRLIKGLLDEFQADDGRLLYVLSIANARDDQPTATLCRLLMAMTDTQREYLSAHAGLPLDFMPPLHD